MTGAPGDLHASDDVFVDDRVGSSTMRTTPREPAGQIHERFVGRLPIQAEGVGERHS